MQQYERSAERFPAGDARAHRFDGRLLSVGGSHTEASFEQAQRPSAGTAAQVDRLTC
jgi:hypothetical protein